MEGLLNEDLFWAIILAFYIQLAMLLSNFLYRRGMPFYLSRKVIHFGAAPAVLLLPILFDLVYFPMLLAALLTFQLTANHMLFTNGTRNLFPGFARAGRLSEVYFALASLISIAALWHIDPWLAVVPPLWLALGDGITGIVRSYTSGREKKDWWGSLACVIVCGAIGIVLVTPVVAGLAGAVTATLAEKYAGDAEGAAIRLDDNIAMPMAGLVGMLPFLLFS
jgi:dolichol kinase